MNKVTLYVDVDSFKGFNAQTEVGKKSGKFFNFKKVDDHYVFSLSNEPQPFIELTQKLFLTVNEWHQFRYTYARKWNNDRFAPFNIDEIGEANPIHKQVNEAFNRIHNKAIECRSGLNPLTMMFGAFFNKLPVPLRWEKKSEKDGYDFCIGLGQHFGLVSLTKPVTRFPDFGSLAQILAGRYVAPQHSLMTYRASCCVFAVALLAATVVMPLFFILAPSEGSKLAYNNLWDRVADYTCMIALSPVIFTLLSVKLLAAAIIHPSIVFKQLD